MGCCSNDYDGPWGTFGRSITNHASQMRLGLASGQTSYTFKSVASAGATMASAFLEAAEAAADECSDEERAETSRATTTCHRRWGGLGGEARGEAKGGSE